MSYPSIANTLTHKLRFLFISNTEVNPHLDIILCNEVFGNSGKLLTGSTQWKAQRKISSSQLRK